MKQIANDCYAGMGCKDAANSIYFLYICEPVNNRGIFCTGTLNEIK